MTSGPSGRRGLSPLEELHRAAARSGDRRARAEQIADTIRATGPHRWVGIYEVDACVGQVSNLAWSGPGAPAHPVFPITRRLTGRAVAERRTVNVGDVAQDADYLTALGDTRSSCPCWLNIHISSFPATHERASC
jgi:putative methionine-R-sulfoxide reductase with GAF domain